MKKLDRRILIVGDLRTAYNYGAIATTEALLKLLREFEPNMEMKMIDHRSFHGTTPDEGWPNIDYRTYYRKMYYERKNSFKGKIVSVAKAVGIYHVLVKIRNRRYKNCDSGNVPARFEDYAEFVQMILEGKTWRYERALLEWADIVVVNSEGNIVHGTDKNGYYRVGGRYVLFMEFLAKSIFHKPCYVVNHTVDPQNRDITKIISNIYPLLDGIYVREKKSLVILNEIGVHNAGYVPDALWSYDFNNDEEVKRPEGLTEFDFQKPYICLGDSSGICNQYSHVKWDVVLVYTSLIETLKKEVCPNIIFVDGYNGENDEINAVIRKNEIQTVNLNTCNYHELYYVLSRAKIFISGRWHASIIALLGHTPVLLWGSDSHKTEALYGEIDYPYEFFDVAALPLNIDRIACEANKIINDSHSEQWHLVERLSKLAKQNNGFLHKDNSK